MSDATERMVERIRARLREIRRGIDSNCEPIPHLFAQYFGEWADLSQVKRKQTGWRRVGADAPWGGKDRTMWLRFFACPGKAHFGKCFGIRLDLGKRNWYGQGGVEALVYVDGKVWHALDGGRSELLLSESARRNDRWEVYVEAFSGMRDYEHVIRRIECFTHDTWVEQFYLDVRTALQVVMLLPPSEGKQSCLLQLLEEAAEAGVRYLHGYAQEDQLARVQQQLCEAVYGNSPGGEEAQVTFVGHAHIDVAWLWQIRHTRKKALRTFSNVLWLMRRYPELCFIQSQPLLYQWVKESEPALFDGVKEAVGSGSWEAEGGMWVEADCNIPGGESLVRQILCGKEYFRDEFGVENCVLWLPDVFGFPAQIPQLMRKSGLRYFMTVKLSWNDTNRFPHDTFLWRGIDGSEVLAHCVTTPAGGFRYEYNGVITPAKVWGCVRNYRQREIAPSVLFTAGLGDGGGGPTREMLEVARRLRNFPGLGRCAFGKARHYFAALEQYNDRYPVWVGELYLEFHRGTYTTQARIKRWNRELERLLHDAEFLCSWTQPVRNYPRAELKRLWTTLLTHQSHDVLAGSCIPEVYRDAEGDYRAARKGCNRLIRDAERAIFRKDRTDVITVYNTTGFRRSELVFVKLPNGGRFVGVVGDDGTSVAVQARSDGRGLWFLTEGVPPYGYKCYRFLEEGGPAKPAETWAEASSNRLENESLRLEFDEAGNIASVWDKNSNRAVLADGCAGNLLEAFWDLPVTRWDAWDIDPHYEKVRWPAKLTGMAILEHGPLRAAIVVRKRILNSDISQAVILTARSRRIDFRTVVNWRDKHVLLKAAFPVSVHADAATYDIQFGNVSRSTRRNTSWERARFEVCAHKWADLSAAGYGVALLNDCKYGYDLADNVMRLSLLRSPTWPDPQADQGRHSFTYSLYPHHGPLQESDVVAQAYCLNYPLRLAQGRPSGSLPNPLVTPSNTGAVIETVKAAETSNALVVRLYESLGKQTETELRMGRKLLSVWECDLLENPERELTCTDNSCRCALSAYEIKTLLIEFEAEPQTAATGNGKR